MSALAARRAALAAKAAIAAEAPPAPSKPTTRSAKPVKQAPKPPPSPTLSDFSGVSEESDDSAGPSNKRRKVAKKLKKTPEKKEKEARYFVGVEIPTRVKPPAPKPRKQRAFSPSAAMEDMGDTTSGESSGEEDLEPVQEEAPAPWSGAPSPWEPRAQSAPASLPCSSLFEVEEDVNFAILTEEQLSEAGIASSGPGVVISVRVQETLAVVGTYSITPLQGALSLLSTTIAPSPDNLSFPVFAPTSHPVPVLARANDEESESDLLESLDLPESFDLSPSQTVFLLTENRTGIEGLTGDVVPGFNNIWLSEEGAWGMKGVHPVLDNFPVPVYPHVTPESWRQALISIVPSDAGADDSDDETPGPAARPPVAIVEGPKRSGKSALARATLNKLLETYAQVAWLECDLGQGEFSCGGAVGLWVLDQPVLGPAFTHQRSPLRAHYLGELSPQSCPDEYMGAIHQLLSYYQYEVQHLSTFLGEAAEGGRRSDAVPLVINTQGWVKGLGEDLLRSIEAVAEPSHVFAFEAATEDVPPGWTASPVHQAMDLPFCAPWENVIARGPAPRVLAVEPAPSSPLQARYSAADMRALATVAYLHSRGDKWDFSVPVLGMRPWVTQLGAVGALRAAYLAGEGADAVLPADLPLALNGSLIGLLEVETSTEEAFVPARPQPSVEEASLLGVALVRAVRASEDSIALQLVTPLPVEVLQRATALVRNGAFELPTCAMLDWRERVPGGGVSEDGLAGVRWDDVPFFDAAGVDAVGAGRRRVRRNIQRKGQ